ncbi:MAG: sigma-70 family RNA polymerase sigma factor [Spirochaetota bacterium]
MPGGKSKRDKYTEIFTEYYHIVFNTIYTKTGNMQDAEDLCQEVFIALYNNLEQILNVRKWIFGTLRNIVLKYYRDKHPEGINIDDVFQDVSLTFVNGFRDLRIIISDSIAKAALDDTDRAIIELIAFHNYSYTTAGRLLGLSKRQVQYKYGQIVKRVIQNLNEKGIRNIEDLL